MPVITKEQMDRRAGGMKIVKWAGNSKKEREKYRLTQEEAVSIGVAGKILPPKVVAEMTGVSVDCVRDLRNGKRGSDGFKKDLMDKIEERVGEKKQKVAEVAVDKLLTSLGLLSDEKMSELGAKDLASAAAQISKVVANMEGKENNGGGATVNIVLYQPKPLKEDHFETIDV